MKKYSSIISVIAFLLIWGIIAVFGNFDNDKAFGIISDFLAIMTGFTITALSIIATSKFSAELYNIEDESDNSKTLLHTLVSRFKNSSLTFITTITLILIYKYFAGGDKNIFYILDNSISLRILLKSLIWLMTLLSLARFIQLIDMFSKFVIKSALKKTE